MYVSITDNVDYYHISISDDNYYHENLNCEHELSETKKVGEVTRFNDERGHGYKIMLENGFQYWLLYDDQPEYLELWLGDDNYSSSDSLMRVKGKSIEDILQD